MSYAFPVEDDEDFSSHVSDFTFGFDDSRLSDRVLMVEILEDDNTQPETSDLHSSDSVSTEPSPEECSRVVKLNVSTILLAANSPFFHKLFTNGMMESEQKSVTLRIDATEEAAFMELMNYMYGGKLASKSTRALLDVLKLADRFQVARCKRLCTSLLRELPVTTESALLFLMYTHQMTDGVQTLTDVAMKFLQTRYKDVDCGSVRDEIMEMPLVGIETILSSNTLRVFSEDKLFDLALKWADAHYPKPEDQQRIFSQHLAHHIRFNYMSLEKLKEVMSSKVFTGDFMYKTLADALFLKLNVPHHHHREMNATVEGSSYGPVVKRAYKRKPVKLVRFEFPRKDLFVYFELHSVECTELDPSEYIYSEAFCFGGHSLYLFAQCHVGPLGGLNFAVGIGVEIHHYAPVTLEYDFAVRSKYREKFVPRSSGFTDFSGGCDKLLHEESWDDFKSGVGIDFVDGVLYVELKLRINE